MKNRIAVLLASLVIVLGWAMPASADTLIKFSGANGNDGTYNGWNSTLGKAENAYAGIYDGTAGGAKTKFICDDFLSNIIGGQTWEATVNKSNPASSGVKFSPATITNPDLKMDETMFGALTQIQEYNMIGYLVEEIYADPINSSHNWADLNGAIWSITDGAWADSAAQYACGTQSCESSQYTGINGGGTLSAKNAVADAYTYVVTDKHSVPDYTVYTPDPPAAAQEFFAPTPEAGTPLLLGLAFFGGSFLRRKLLA
jgi:hypothetical protein